MRKLDYYPKDAAAVILLRHQLIQNPEVFLVQAQRKARFLGGYHAFPGGQFMLQTLRLR